MEGPREITQAEKVEMERVRAELGHSFCHRCDYCQPCTADIPISTVMTSPSFAKRIPPERFFSGYTLDALAKAGGCTRCGECEQRCPYHLHIMDQMERLSAWYAGEKKKYEGSLR
jgi:predicted aldo/keto reductase-like oxidoreductase